MDLVNDGGMAGAEGEGEGAAATRGRRSRRRRGRRESTASWPLLILHCVSAIGMAQGRLLLIELMMPPPPDPCPPMMPPPPGCTGGPIIEPPEIQPPEMWSSEILESDPDYIAVPTDSMKKPEEIPEGAPEEPSSVEVEYELTPPETEEKATGIEHIEPDLPPQYEERDQEEEKGLPKLELDDVDYGEGLPPLVANTDEMTVVDEDEPEVKMERGKGRRRRGRLARRKYRTLTGNFLTGHLSGKAGFDLDGL